MDQLKLRDLKLRVDIVRLCVVLGVDLKRVGSNYVGHYPLHDDKNPSFSVDRVKGLWHCFGCNSGGDQISLVEVIKSYSFKDSVNYLVSLVNNGTGTPLSSVYVSKGGSSTQLIGMRAPKGGTNDKPIGMCIPQEDTNGSKFPMVSPPLDRADQFFNNSNNNSNNSQNNIKNNSNKNISIGTKSPKELLDRVVSHYHVNLLKSDKAKGYLKKRGIYNEEVLTKYMIGYCERHSLKDLLSKEDYDVLIDLGLIRGGIGGFDYIETRLYYYGARYYDPKTSIWLSADPALGKYLPTFPTKEKEVQKLTTNPMAYWAKELPGMGGVYNSPNLNFYTYSHQNPVKYIDPDGKSIKWAIGRAAMLMTARGRAATWRDIKEYRKFVAQSSKNLYHNVSTLWTGGLTSKATNYALGDIKRVKHAASRLTNAGVLPNWSNVTKDKFIEMASKILKNPIKTFERVASQGKETVQGFYGKVGDKPVVIFVYKTGKDVGRVATSYIPSAQQMKNWKLK